MKKLSDMSISEMLESATDGMNLFIEEDFSSENTGVGDDIASPDKENEMDKREAIREIMAISAKPVSEFEGGEEEKIETIAKIAEKLAYKPSETGSNDEDPEEEEKPCAKDETEPKGEEAKSALAEKVNGVEKAVDELPAKVLQMIANREALYNQVSTLVGTFDHATMTEEQVAKYACDKLDVLKDTPAEQAVAVLKGYLKAQKPAQILTMDGAPKADETDAHFEAFLKGE